MGADGKPVLEAHGQVKVRQGYSEVRTAFDYPEPFALYFGESVSVVQKLPIVPRDHAIKLECIRDFKDDKGVSKSAGDEWLEYGPLIYIPRPEVKIVQNI
jgi:major vault protein